MTNKPYHHGNLRESLIEAGIALLHKGEEAQLSLRKVASLCGVSQAAPYSHFQNKEDLLAAIREYVMSQFMKALEDTVRSFQNQQDPKILVQIGKSYVLFFIKNPQYFSFIFSQHCMEIYLSLDDDGADNFPPFKLFKAYAVPILGELGVQKNKIEDAIISMWATVHGLASIATMKNVHYDKDWESKIEGIIWNQ
jgi:AcrR family transcriptional regulator